LVESVEDIVEEISLLAEFIRKKAKAESSQLKKGGKERESDELPLVSELEQKILKLLSASYEGLNIDQLIKTTNCSFGQLSEALISLELKGLVKSLPGKTYLLSGKKER
ncbi:MAG: hypothetical protein QME68_01570, partial [Elusimicrobiota bacterium]|nr:hypothetical protein [Elusimicrobiota bacterium]